MFVTALRPSPALQVAEVQQVKLSVVLGVIDGVHILGATFTHEPVCRSI